MKTVILAGGMGTRLSEETSERPKPMVEVGGLPIIVHIMNIYSRYKYSDFLIASGYKSHVIKEYFINQFYMESDLTISLSDGSLVAANSERRNWTVSIVDTGANTMTGGRLLRLRDWVNNATFMCTYGDGLASIDIAALVAFHRSHGKLATITAVHPPARFGDLIIDGSRVVSFAEKQQSKDSWINGGFFVFEPQVIDYVEGDAEPLERAPLSNLASDGQLMAYQHEGFWHPMDTIRDRNYLSELLDSDRAPWIDDIV